MQPKTDAKLNMNFSMAEEDMNLLDREQQVIVKYNGDIEKVAEAEGGVVQIISEKYAAIRIPLEQAKNLVQYPEVEYMEAPKNFVYNLEESTKVACITPVQAPTSYGLSGKGVLLGIIDSGITYQHPDFRNEDGSTRIAFLWDQSRDGSPPTGFLQGTEYTKAQIDEALAQPTRFEQLQIVPSEDTVGHGTHVASIAGGNGRASRGRNKGVAPEAEFIVVKLDSPPNTDFVRTLDIMLGVKYVLEKASLLGKPIAINISVGMNEGSHDGQSLIEQYLDEASQVWKTNIVVGSGNEGGSRNHYSGFVSTRGMDGFEISMGENKKQYQFSLWQNAIDNLSYQVVAPNGDKSTPMLYGQPPRRFALGDTIVYISFAGPSPLNGAIQLGVFLGGMNGKNINSGIWRINVFGEQVTDGRYNVWGETREIAGDDTFFVQTEPLTTLTTPSTASNVITVGAYNPITNQIASFSGRGFTRTLSSVKPDLVAPGVNILAASNTGGYISYSGTSMATPFVTGSIALMMEWGIVEGRNPFLYGETARAYLLRGTRKDVTGVTYPDTSWGYGKLCLKNTMDDLRRTQLI